jgi:hypothetical protein
VSAVVSGAFTMVSLISGPGLEIKENVDCNLLG